MITRKKIAKYAKKILKKARELFTLSKVSFKSLVIAPAVTGTELTDHEKNFLNNISKKLTFFVGLPTLVTFIYFMLFSQNLYQSESKFIIQTNNQEQSIAGGFLGAITNTSSSFDPYVIKQFIHSRDLLEKLINKHQFVEKQVRTSPDILFGLGRNSDFETLYQYYKKQVHISFDPTSSILTLNVKAPKAVDAKEIAQNILNYSEQMVNLLSKRAYQDRIMFAEAELDKAEDKLGKAKAALVKFQNSIEEVNPIEKVQSIMHIRNELESQLAHTKTSLKELVLIKKKDSPECQNLGRRIQALEDQIQKENAKLLSVKSSGLNTAIATQESLLIEKEFSQNLYQLALGELEKARIDAVKQTRYLVTIASPSLPDKAYEPKVLRGLLAVSVLSFLLLAIGSLFLATIREHALF